MNNQTQDWKCPICDTINTKGRCVICGSEKPKPRVEIKNTMHKSDSTNANKTMLNKNEKVKSSKGLIIALCSVIGVLVIGIIVICAVFLSGEDEARKTPYNSHEVAIEKQDHKDKDKKEVNAEPEDKYITEAVYNEELNVSVDKHYMVKNPSYDEIEDEDMICAVPSNFGHKGDDEVYYADDDTAYIMFVKDYKDDDETASDILKKRKDELGGQASLSRTDKTGYAVSVLRNAVIYYEKGIINDNNIISFVFVYPEKYRDIYDDYVDDLLDGFSAVEKEESEETEPAEAVDMSETSDNIESAN